MSITQKTQQMKYNKINNKKLKSKATAFTCVEFQVNKVGKIMTHCINV